MSLLDTIKNYFRRSREKHKLSFINDTNYQEKWSFRVSSFNILTLLALYTILVSLGTIFLIRSTPLKTLIVENKLYADEAEIDKNSSAIDSLYRLTASNEKYLQNLKMILNDEVYADSTQNTLDEHLENYNPDFTKDPSDSILRKKVEESTTKSLNPSANESYAFFFAPVNGIVSRSFNPTKSHFGVDVVTAEDEPIKSCLEGTIIFTGWVPSEGNVIVVQHKNNMLSVYKHCSAVLKEQGVIVQTGDPIGIVGNSGENTSGPHLHFELWQNGHLMNPEDYITF